MSTAEKMNQAPTPREVEDDLNSELTHDEWGNGMVYVSHPEAEGEWVGYDPDDTVDLEANR